MGNRISAGVAARMVSRFRSKAEGDVEEITGLNITAMMDMMTILLVFLLKSFAVSSGMIPPSDTELTLPRSASATKPANFLVITVTKSAILVDGEPVINIEDDGRHEFQKRVTLNPEIKELKDLIELHGQVYEIKAKEDGKEYERKLLLVADKNTPYYTILSVAYTAAQAKYLKYQMVVISTTAGE